MSAVSEWPGGILTLVSAGTHLPGINVTATLPAGHMCPYRDEVDEGEVTITWLVTGGLTIELHSLRELLDFVDEWVVSHEAYTAGLRALLELDHQVKVVSVVSRWITAGGAVEISV